MKPIPKAFPMMLVVLGLLLPHHAALSTLAAGNLHEKIECSVRVYRDGLVQVTLTFTAGSGIHNVSLIGRPLGNTVFINTSGNVSYAAYYDERSNSLLIAISREARIHVEYYSYTLTSKNESLWTLTIPPTACRLRVVMPSEWVVIPERLPEDLEVNNVLVMVYDNVTYPLKIHYIPYRYQGQATATTQPTTTTLATTSPTETAAPGVPEGLARRNLLLATVILGSAMGGLLYYLARRRRVPELGVPGEYMLDDRDREILNYVRSHGGEVLQASIVKELGLPKSVVSRKVGKLSKYGLLETLKRGKVKIVRIKRGEEKPS